MPISTHALTEGDRKTESVLCIDNISTHALTEGDYAGLTPTSTSVIISTHALTEGDSLKGHVPAGTSISTHALTEGDHPTEPRVAFGTYFNSRPHGGRLQKPDGCMSRTYFNSRRATPPLRAVSSLLSYFNSRPHKGRRYDTSVYCVNQHFNSFPHRGRLSISI